jgi:hypothetical protein
MEMRTIVQRDAIYYLISTVDHGRGDYPFETTIVRSSTDGYMFSPIYRCHYLTLTFAMAGHRNLVELWPGP